MFVCILVESGVRGIKSWLSVGTFSSGSPVGSDLLSQMLFGGGSRSGGCFGTLGATVPQNDSLKARGGAWAPPPLMSSSESCFAIMSCRCVFLLVASFSASFSGV